MSGEQSDMFGAPVPTAKAPVRRAPSFYVIPIDAKLGRCRGGDCTASVYWIGGIPCPVTADVDGGKHPTATEDGRGLSHFLDCPNADEFSGGCKGKRGR